MKKKLKFGITSQAYETPHAESVAVAQESILCASQPELDGGLQEFENETTDGTWD